MEVSMLKFIRQTVLWMALPAVIGMIIPASAIGGGHGPGRGGAGRGGSPRNHVGPIASQKGRGPVNARARVGQSRARVNARRAPNVAARRPGRGSILNYNAYWRAATSPVPPNPKQSYSTYWQKMQAQKQYQQRPQR
jgi:hypothetical protein